MDVRSSPRSSVFRLRDRILKSLRNPALATGGYIPVVKSLVNIPDDINIEDFIYDLTYKLYDPELTRAEIKLIKNKLAEIMEHLKEDNRKIFREISKEKRIFNIGKRNALAKVRKNSKIIEAKIKALQTKRKLASVKNAVWNEIMDYPSTTTPSFHQLFNVSLPERKTRRRKTRGRKTKDVEMTDVSTPTKRVRKTKTTKTKIRRPSKAEREYARQLTEEYYANHPTMESQMYGDPALTFKEEDELNEWHKLDEETKTMLADARGVNNPDETNDDMLRIDLVQDYRHLHGIEGYGHGINPRINPLSTRMNKSVFNINPAQLHLRTGRGYGLVNETVKGGAFRNPQFANFIEQLNIYRSQNPDVPYREAQRIVSQMLRS